MLNDGDFRAVRRKEVQAFRTKNLRDDEKVMWKGVLITSVERTVFDLSHELSPYQLVQLIDGAINAHGGYRTIEPLTSIDKLFALCRNHRGERGVKKLKLCLQRARVGSDSAQETLLRLLLEDHGVKDLALNKAVYGEHGELLFQADLAVEKERISIQYEGEHHSGVEQMQKDIHRQRRTESMGWKEVRIVSKDLYQSEFDHEVKDWVPRAVLLVRRAFNQARGVTYHSKNTPN
ncbi:hypothetical protein [Rothia aerolata]|uniref:DUF559 domain-containing protein n=1 Tax=Rothia aerolata TaxID=1812262 RepID=A0A917MS17_9MICC|nr:hypothetical protein [Rothia aerolata]GGH60811.1 hypothetical protein GCM10007359_09370 [Rothia aerolata]